LGTSLENPSPSSAPLAVGSSTGSSSQLHHSRSAPSSPFSRTPSRGQQWDGGFLIDARPMSPCSGLRNGKRRSGSDAICPSRHCRGQQLPVFKAQSHRNPNRTAIPTATWLTSDQNAVETGSCLYVVDRVGGPHELNNRFLAGPSAKPLIDLSLDLFGGNDRASVP